MLCPHCQTPAVPGLCRAGQPQDTLVHIREHRPGVSTPFLTQTAGDEGRKEKKILV